MPVYEYRELLLSRRLITISRSGRFAGIGNAAELSRIRKSSCRS